MAKNLTITVHYYPNHDTNEHLKMCYYTTTHNRAHQTSWNNGTKHVHLRCNRRPICYLFSTDFFTTCCILNTVFLLHVNGSQRLHQHKVRFLATK